MKVACSWCHTVADPGLCPTCGHENDVARVECACRQCVGTDARHPTVVTLGEEDSR